MRFDSGVKKSPASRTEREFPKRSRISSASLEPMFTVLPRLFHGSRSWAMLFSLSLGRTPPSSTPRSSSSSCRCWGKKNTSLRGSLLLSLRRFNFLIRPTQLAFPIYLDWRSDPIRAGEEEPRRGFSGRSNLCGTHLNPDLRPPSPGLAWKQFFFTVTNVMIDFRWKLLSDWDGQTERKIDSNY